MSHFRFSSLTKSTLTENKKKKLKLLLKSFSVEGTIHGKTIICEVHFSNNL